MGGGRGGLGTGFWGFRLGPVSGLGLRDVEGGWLLQVGVQKGSGFFCCSRLGL